MSNRRAAARAAPARIRRMLRDSLRDLFDQRKPFGRLALAHVLFTAGDTLVTISLAGSLFFSIKPTEAKGKVILYLLLTIAPFAVVAPLLGPLIDRSRGARRAMVVVSGALRAFVCILMARDVNSLLLFPEAFAALVLSKLYLVTKGALVPLMAGPGDGTPAERHGRPGAPSTWAEQAAADQGWVAPEAPTPPAGTAALAPADHPTPPEGVAVAGAPTGAPDAGAAPAAPAARRVPDLSVLNARLGLLAALAGFAASLPAIITLKFLGGAPSVLWLDVAVFIAAAVAGFRLPVGRDADAARQLAVDRPAVPHHWRGEGTLFDALGPRAATHPQAWAASTPMYVLRGLGGYVTFLLAFALKYEHAATWWYGFMLAASTAGALVGVVLLPRLRRLLGEPQILVGALWAVAVAAALAAAVGGRVIQGLLAFVIGVSAAAAKPAFDALVQRYVPPAAQGRAFARFETRLQLSWVAGAFIPVAAANSLAAGDLIVVAFAVFGAATYLGQRRALRAR